MSGAADVLTALLSASSSKVRTLQVTATGESEEGSEVVVCGCLERRGSTFKIGQCGIVATDGATVWGAVLDERAHKADNQVCRALSRRAWVSKLMSTLEAAESAITATGGGAAASAVEVVLRGDARSTSSVARLRVAAVGPDAPDAAAAVAPSASPASLASSQGGAAGAAADGRPAARVVYLSTFVELKRMEGRQAAGLLRALCGSRLAMANRTARSVRERQAQLEADAAEAGRMAAEVGDRAIAERGRLVAAAVALVNAKKDRLAELDERAREAERQRTEAMAAVRGLEGELAKLRRRLERAEAAAADATGGGSGGSGGGGGSGGRGSHGGVRNAAARAAARRAAADADHADGIDAAAPPRPVAAAASKSRAGEAASEPSRAREASTAAAAGAVAAGEVGGGSGGGGASGRRALKRLRQRRSNASEDELEEEESETEEDGADGWDSDASEDEEEEEEEEAEDEEEALAAGAADGRAGAARTAGGGAKASARQRLLPARAPPKRARLARRASSEDELEREASAGDGMIVGALAALRQRAGGVRTRQSSAASLAASRQGSAVSQANSDDWLQ